MVIGGFGSFGSRPGGGVPAAVGGAVIAGGVPGLIRHARKRRRAEEAEEASKASERYEYYDTRWRTALDDYDSTQNYRHFFTDIAPENRPHPDENPQFWDALRELRRQEDIARSEEHHRAEVERADRHRAEDIERADRIRAEDIRRQDEWLGALNPFARSGISSSVAHVNVPAAASPSRKNPSAPSNPAHRPLEEEMSFLDLLTNPFFMGNALRLFSFLVR